MNDIINHMYMHHGFLPLNLSSASIKDAKFSLLVGDIELGSIAVLRKKNAILLKRRIIA